MAGRGWAGRGSTYAWRKARAACLERDGHTCQLCGAHATHADHVLARALGGGDELSNLRALCSRCNCSAGTATARAARARAQTRLGHWLTG